MTKPVFSGDVAISGGGMAGLSLALALHRAGLDVALVDAAPLDTQHTPEFDGRASAIAYTSWRLLEASGIAPHLAAHVQRIEDILVVDGRPHDGLKPGGPGRASLHFDRREISDGEDGEPLGYMAENRHTRLALAAAAEDAGLTVIAPARAVSMEAGQGSARLHLEDGRALDASLIVAADGKFSSLREGAGIRTVGRDYPQKGLVTTVTHELPHEGVAYEFFMPAGPFAILPLPGRRSSIVWTERAEWAPAFMALDEAEFNRELAKRVGDFLGGVRLVGPRWSYPLGLQAAERAVAQRLALVGDALHGMHPIAGQGLNMGFRDVAALADVVEDNARLGLDLGARDALERYERARRFDNTLMLAMTDGLNRLFSNDIAPVRLARDVGLGMVNGIPPLKKFFMRQAMGAVGDLPRLMRA